MWYHVHKINLVSNWNSKCKNLFFKKEQWDDEAIETIFSLHIKKGGYAFLFQFWEHLIFYYNKKWIFSCKIISIIKYSCHV